MNKASGIKCAFNIERVIVDGKDITKDCYQFNTKTKEFHCYTRNDKGSFFINKDTHESDKIIIKANSKIEIYFFNEKEVFVYEC